MNAYVRHLFEFPVKSLRGQSCAELAMENRGSRYDRRWMLVNEKGRFITQREKPQLLGLQARQNDDWLHLSVRGQAEKNFSICASQLTPNERAVRIWKDQIISCDAGDEAAHWLHEQLGLPLRLVYLADEHPRPVDPDYATAEAQTVSFADGFPVLLISQSAVDELSEKLGRHFDAMRLRPNILIAGCPPFAEDDWQQIQIGDLRFDVVKPCSRCIIPTLNLSTHKSEKDVNKVLATYRRRDDRKIYFGQNLIPRNEGRLCLGDSVKILK